MAWVSQHVRQRGSREQIRGRAFWKCALEMSSSMVLAVKERGRRWRTWLGREERVAVRQLRWRLFDAFSSDGMNNFSGEAESK